jgi:hypothetical protein
MVAGMLLRIRGIEVSWLYQDIFARGLAEGEAKEAREILLKWGRRMLGEPDAQGLSKIAAISELDRLNFLLDRILDAQDWSDLLDSLNP